MAYSSQAQLETRYGTQLLVEISDRDDVPGGIVDAALIARAIADADALIDGYLSSRYALPLAATPAIVTDLSLRIAIYYAHTNVASEKITKDYEFALRQLKDISAGTLKLNADGVEPEGAGSLEVLTNEPERTFTPDTMTGFI
jgi:phage gp36-like protein